MKVPNHNERATIACVYSNGFSEGEMGKLDDYLSTLKLSGAAVGSGKPAIESVRISDVSFFTPEELPWFSIKMHEIINKINRDWFKVNISEFPEGFQYTVYEGSAKGHYNWHADSNGDPAQSTTRKLSMILMLSEYTDYKGGAFQERLSGAIVSHKLNRGDILVIPSYALHRVKPVLSGTRKTIVSWLGGPQWI